MLTIATYDEETHTFYARTLDATAASGDIVIPGRATDDEIRDYANEHLGAPECGDFSHASIARENATTTLAQLIERYDANGFILIDDGNGSGGPNWQPWDEQAAAYWGHVEMTPHNTTTPAYEDTVDSMLDVIREVIPEYFSPEIHASEWRINDNRGGELLPDNPYRYRILF